MHLNYETLLLALVLYGVPREMLSCAFLREGSTETSCSGETSDHFKVFMKLIWNSVSIS